MRNDSGQRELLLSFGALIDERGTDVMYCGQLFHGWPQWITYSHPCEVPSHNDLGLVCVACFGQWDMMQAAPL